MTQFEKIINEAMKDKCFTVRSLEAEIIKKHGLKKKISRGMIGDYKLGKRAPTYDRALILADVLEIDKVEILVATFKSKNQRRKDAEWDRLKEYCKRNNIKIDKRRVP